MDSKDVRFAFFPTSQETTASARMRVYTTVRVLLARGIPCSIGPSSDANVYYIQKKVTPEIIEIARKAKKTNRAVIYDVDDIGEALWYWVTPRLFRRMIRLADRIVTCSPELADLLVKQTPIRDPAIVPPCVDYYPTSPAALFPLPPTPFRILWFGSSGTFHSFEPYIKLLVEIPDTQVVVCMGEEGRPQADKYTGLQFIPWDLANFVSVLQSCHITCLSHEGSSVVRAKTNNKMITSITWGVPAVVSATSDYLRTAQAAGIEYATFSSIGDLKRIVVEMRSEQRRRQYLDSAQPVIWETQSPDAVTDMLLNVASGIKQKNSLQRMLQLAGSFL